MLDAQRPDFVVNVTAPAAHHAVTLAALRHGVPVLSEKPMAASLAEAVEMVAAADRAERLLMVSQNRRYMPELAAFRDRSGGSGRSPASRCEFFIAHRDRRRRVPARFAQPLLLDMAIHLFDAARAITGADPLSVYCEAYNPPWSWYAGPAAASAIFRMSDGLRFTFTGNWAAPWLRDVVDGLLARHRRARQRDLGRRGRAAGGARPRRARRRRRARHRPARPRALPRPRGSAGRLRRRAAHRLVPAGECHDNLRSLAMCHAAVESAALGAPVAVEPGSDDSAAAAA